jgi:drug/metabolite transporter (DMT)-like permease
MQMKIILKKVLGIILIIAGLVALLTPLTPGSWLALIGMELLGVHLLVAKKLLSDKQRAAVKRFMRRFGLKFSIGRNDNKPGTRAE